MDLLVVIQPLGAQLGAAAAAAVAVGKEDVSAASRCTRICGHLCEFVELKPSDVVSVTKHVLDVDRAQLGTKAARPAAGVLDEAVQQLLSVAEVADGSEGGLPAPLSARELKIVGMEFVEAYAARNDLASQVCCLHLHNCGE